MAAIVAWWARNGVCEPELASWAFTPEDYELPEDAYGEFEPVQVWTPTLIPPNPVSHSTKIGLDDDEPTEEELKDG